MRLLFALAAFVGLGLQASAPAQAQASTPPVPLADGPRVLAGPGLGPGLGATATFSLPVATVFLAEGTLYADYAPRVVGSSGRLVVGVGAGGAVRVLRAAAIVRNEDVGRLDIDLGARLGPSFYVAFFEPSAASQARAFSVMLDPFVRGTYRLNERRTVYLELGPHEPSLRGGLAFALPRR